MGVFAGFFSNPELKASFQSANSIESVLSHPGRCQFGDAEIAAWLAVTTPSRVVLGRTSITITGLSSLLNSYESIAFLEGSFDEEALRQLRPLTIPNSIGISGKSLTGDFSANGVDYRTGWMHPAVRSRMFNWRNWLNDRLRGLLRYVW